MLTSQEAIEIVLRTVRPIPPVKVPLAECLGRVLAETVCSRWDLPPADNSAMDGYTFAFSGQREGSEMPVGGFVPAGTVLEAVTAGAAVRIMTGAPLPAGCDTVVPLEETTEVGERLRLLKTPRKGQHVRRQGEEMGVGEELLSPGTPLHSGEIALLAAAGIESAAVRPAPRVAVLSTGDELVDLGQIPGPGQIVNSNVHLLTSRLREEGCEVVSLGIARDQAGELEEKIVRGLEADLLITTGGVSVGDRDLVQEVLKGQGFEIGFWKVAIKPGKPVLFGTVHGTPVFGLPGNPAASAATFELFVRPALRRLAGFNDPLPPRLRVRLGEAIQGGEKRERFLWGTLFEEEGRYLFCPSPRQGSGQNRSLQGAQALLPVRGGSPEIAAGSEVEVMMLRLPPGLPRP
jgi:molybdopterin molybdotransferase